MIQASCLRRPCSGPGDDIDIGGAIDVGLVLQMARRGPI